MKLYDDPSRGAEDLGGPRGGPRRHRLHPRRARHLAGLGGLRRAARAGRRRTCATSAKLLDRYGYDCALYGHFGQGCIHCRIDFDLDTRRGHRASTRLHGRGGRPGRLATAARSRASTATARRAASCCRRCTAPELVQAFREFKAIWDPDWTDEPGQGGRRLPDRREPAPRRRLPARPARDPLQVPRRRRQLRPRGPALRRRRASAGATTAGRMCPSYMVTHEEKHSTRGRAHLLFEMLQGDPITDGWRDETVQRGARPLPRLQGMQGRVPGATSTWRRTRPSSSRTTTRAGCGRGTPTRWADPLVGAAGRARRPRSPTSSRQTPGSRDARQVRWRDLARRQSAAVRRRDVQGVVRRRRPAEPGTADR